MDNIHSCLTGLITWMTVGTT